jgi:cytochrome o ubiquinol oxidase operon protein cyoD
MSAHHDHNHGGDHGHHDHGHGHDDHFHISLKGYVTGFVLAVLLTVIPFWLVMGHVFSKSTTTGIVVLAFAAVQVVVHMIYFLHMNDKVEGGWSMLSMIFTIMVVFIMFSGSLWVMYHLKHNMMPGFMDETIPQSIQQGPSANNLP